jgi:DNA-directed RNA polymerase specialized sigma24 family protein
MPDEPIADLAGLDWEELAHEELVQQARAFDATGPADSAGRRAGLAAIFARHHRIVLAYCGGLPQNPHAAADAAAETFAAIYYAALRPEEAVNPRKTNLAIPARARMVEQWKSP